MTKRCMYGAPEVWHALMEKLTETSIAYLRAKVAAGADAVQLFDSWVGALSRRRLRRVRRAVLRGASSRRSEVPTIHFGTGTAHLLEAMAEAGGDVIGLDWRVPLDEGWERVGHDRGVQGNLDPALLLGPFERAARAALTVLERGGRSAGAHLQPRPRGAAGHRSRRPAPAGRPRARAHSERCCVKPAVVLMAYGSPSDLDDIRPYLEDIRGGRPVSDEAVEELTERYRRIGGRSPLDDVTEETRAALERELGLPVYVGMKHWSPRIAEAVERALAGGADTIVGLVLAPHYSTLSIDGYRERLEQGLVRPGQSSGSSRAGTTTSPTWTCSPTGSAARTRTWSSPRTAFRRGSSTRATRTRSSCSRRRRLVAERAGLESWSFAFQSASTTGEPWLGPDILDELDALHARGVERVLVCPIGFVSDHLEILWDIDVEGRERAAELGLDFDRIESLNDDPALVRGLAELVREAVSVPST